MWREVVFCLYSSLKPHMEHCVQLRAPQYKNKMDLLDSEGLQRWLGDWNIFQMRRAWKSWDCSAWRREAWRCLTHMYKYLRGWNEECNARLFSVLLRDKRQWAQIENHGIPSEHKKTLFYCEAGQTHCPERLRHSMSNWAWFWVTSSSWPCVSKKVGFMKCFPIETILLFWDCVAVYDYLTWGYGED